MSLLFEPVRLGGLDLANRILIAPMCQYSAKDGVIQPWHWQHLGALAVSGAGAVIVEASAVRPDGRISLGDCGLWNDEQEAAFTRLRRDILSYSATPLGVQLAHAGRKASTHPPWTARGGPLGPDQGAWPTQAPSALPFDDDWPAPVALDPASMAEIVEDFARAAKRADRAGFDLVEIHAAHGYLLSEFLSPLSNRRTDHYGGSLENRMRFPLEVAQAVRSVWPERKALGLRLNGTDWVEGGVTAEETGRVALSLKAMGFDYVHISSGGNAPRARIPGREPGYQVSLAASVKRDVPDLTVVAVGMINTPQQAEAVLAAGEADMIALARPVLDDPRWPLRAAATLDAVAPYPHQYERAAPHLWPGYAMAHPD